jgi:hypothetical protein
MSYNSQHYRTFLALLQVWGLPEEMASRISSILANADNTEQDKLIEFIAVQLQQKQSPPQV